jgi:hypothetical protein
MLRHLSDDIVVNLKDGLRGVRHVIRANRHDRLLPTRRPRSPGELPDMLLGTAATAVDTALSLAQSLSVSLISDDREILSRTGRVGGLTRYFSNPDGARLFRREMYYLTRELLHRYVRQDVFIHEAAFAEIHLCLKRDHAIVFEKAVSEGASDADIARACAFLAIESVKRHAVRIVERGAPLPVTSALEKDAEIVLFSATGLAIALATVAHRDGLTNNGADLIESAFLAVSAQEERFIAAFASHDPSASVAEHFKRLMAYLP